MVRDGAKRRLLTMRDSIDPQFMVAKTAKHGMLRTS